MVNFSQHPAGPGCQVRRKMLCAFLWFIFSGFAGDFLSAVAYTTNENQGVSQIPSNSSIKGILQNASVSKKNADNSIYKDVNTDSVLHRSLRALPRIKNPNEFPLENLLGDDTNSESVQKSPTKSKTFFVIPYLRPGRFVNRNEVQDISKKGNAMIPVARLGRSDLISRESELNNYKLVSKKHDTIIPMVRFGRNNVKDSASTSIIPYPRMGRSSFFKGENDINNDFEDNSEDNEYESSENVLPIELNVSIEEVEAYVDTLSTEKREKRDFADYDTIIPYPRPGRNLLDSQNVILDKENKKADYVLPQIRYGRSVILLSSPKTDENTKQNPHTFVLPYPRPGRSTKQPEKNPNSKNLHVLLPYPRPGRSIYDENAAIRFKFDKKRQDYMLPTARLGRSALNIPYELEGKNSMDADDEGFLGLKVNPLFMKSEQRNLSGKPKDIADSNSVFVIPYPRPGKKSMKLTSSSAKQKTNDIGKGITDFVLPYPRPGKKSNKQNSAKITKHNNNENENTLAQNFILPYPRPGRSETDSFEVDEEQDQIMQSENMGSNVEKNQNFGVEEVSVTENKDINEIEDTGDYVWKDNKKSENTFVIPYARLGRKSENIIPYPRPGRSYNQYKNSHLSQNKDEIDSDQSRSDYESFITEIGFPDLYTDSSSHLRSKRSNSIVPYPRPGRSETVLPYPRLGRSDSVVPYPRLGRSTSIVPYPRPGRSNSVVPYPRLGRSNSVVPYPRPGRSNTVVPYPRPGRSNSVLPYPRLGRSNYVVPYQRLRRSNYVLPYPRLGRSNTVVPYPRLGRSNFVVPYPRLGRSHSVIPYPRLGRSNSVVPYPRLGRSDSIVPYPRLGRSNSVVPYPRVGRSNSIVPYPRPGRSDFVVPYPRPGRSESIIPYPRPGRSFSVVPYLRLGRSRSENAISSTEYKDKTGNWILPNLRPGRSNSNEEVNYIIPYPRPGRSENEEAFLYSQDSGFNMKRSENNMVIPYPRPGRSIRNDQEYILSHTSIGGPGISTINGETNNEDSVPLYTRLGRSQTQVTPTPDVVNSVHKLNKHMLSRVDDSIYLLPYPRPGRFSE